MHREGSREVGLVEHPSGHGFNSHASLFRHYVTLRVVLSEHWIRHAVSFECEPEFGAIRRQFHEVDRCFVRCRGV